MALRSMLFVVLLVFGTITIYVSVTANAPRMSSQNPPRTLLPSQSQAWVSMNIDDTVRYQLNGPEAAEEFASLVPPRGHVVYPDGPQSAPYTVALFHQLRCLDVIRKDYAALTGPSALSVHCLQYLRQTILCLADTRLEPVRSPVGPRIVRFSSDYICRDWEPVYSAAAKISR